MHLVGPGLQWVPPSRSVLGRHPRATATKHVRRPLRLSPPRPATLRRQHVDDQNDDMQFRKLHNAPGPRIRCAHSVEVRRYPRSRRRQGTWWAPRSSKPVWGRELPGGFDSRPPPPVESGLLQAASEAGVGRPRKGLDRSSGDRVYHTSLSVIASRAATGPAPRSAREGPAVGPPSD